MGGGVASNELTITHTDSETQYNGSFQSVWTFTSQSIGTADASRLVVVLVSSFDDAVAGALTSITVGGVSCAIEEFTHDNVYRASISAAARAIPTGNTATVVVTFTTSRPECSINVFAITGDRVASATPISSGGSTYVNTTTPLVPSVDVGAGAVVLSGICCYVGGGVNYGSTSDLTNFFEMQNPTGYESSVAWGWEPTGTVAVSWYPTPAGTWGLADVAGAWAFT